MKVSWCRVKNCYKRELLDTKSYEIPSCGADGVVLMYVDDKQYCLLMHLYLMECALWEWW